MVEGFHFRDYLEVRRLARLGSWMLNGLGSLRVRVSAEDLAGVWSEGEVLSKRELYERTKRRILEKRYNESSRLSGGDGS